MITDLTIDAWLESEDTEARSNMENNEQRPIQHAPSSSEDSTDEENATLRTSRHAIRTHQSPTPDEVTLLTSRPAIDRRAYRIPKMVRIYCVFLYLFSDLLNFIHYILFSVDG